MGKHNRNYPELRVLSAAMLSLAFLSCALSSTPPPPVRPTPFSEETALKMQAPVRDMAVDHIASLGEGVYLLTRAASADSPAREGR
jgi:hypothetical protein